MNNKKGSTSVFLVYILAAMIGVTAMFIIAAKQKAYISMGDGALNLAMRSVLSEFDLTLKDRYGLMAFEKSGMEAALEINDYMDYTFKDESPVKKIKVKSGSYSLSDINVFREQIIEYMQLKAVKDLLTQKKIDHKEEAFTDRTLRNKAVIETLPSKPYGESGTGFLDRVERLKNQLKSADDIFNETKETYLIDLYILDHFNYATNISDKNETFYSHEVEYIITGDLSNEKNRKTVEKGLKVLRTALNAAYITEDEKKMALVTAAAGVIAPEAAPAAEAVIIATWAAAEADNDVKLLLDGKPVPLMKNEGCWATDLDSVLNNTSADYIDTVNTKGLFYSDYMMIFLHFQGEETKLSRAADLIQINMKGTYDRDFTMKGVKSGLKLTAEFYGKERAYETCY